MKYEHALLKTLRIPAELPEVIASLTVDVIYTPAAVAEGHPEERTETIGETMDDLARLLQSGFLSRPFNAASSAAITTELSAPNQMRLSLTGSGFHVNIVPMLIRIMLHMHQTPEGAFEELVAVLESEEMALEVYGGIKYMDAVQSLSINAQAMPASKMLEPDPLNARRSGVALLNNGPLSEDRVVDAEELRFSGIPETALTGELEDAFLSISMFNAFVPIDTVIDFTPGEEEFFFYKNLLLVQNVSIEQVYLYEFLSCLAGGTLAQVVGKVMP